MTHKRKTPLGDSGVAVGATENEQRPQYGANGGGGQALKSRTPTEGVFVFEMTEDYLPPEHEDYMHGWFWSLGNDHNPVAGPFASREEAERHAKLLVSPRPVITESHVVRFEFIRACNHLVAYLDTQELEDFEIRNAVGEDVPHDISHDIEIVRHGVAAVMDWRHMKKR